MNINSHSFIVLMCVDMKRIAITYLALHITIAVFGQNPTDFDLQGKWLGIVGETCHDSINSIEFFPDGTFLQIGWQTSGPFDWVAKRGDYRIIDIEGEMFLHMINEEMQYGTGGEFSSNINLNSNSPPQSKYVLLSDSSGFCLVALKNILTGSEYEWINPRCYVNSLYLQSDVNQSESLGVFLIPSGYTGRIMVALNQESGQEVVFDERSRRVLSIPGNGLLKTQAKPMPMAFAKNQFKYYYQTDEGVLNELKNISGSCLNSFAGLSEEELNNLGYDPDEVYVYPFRYNPARNLINEHFEEEIVGQIKLIIVDVLRDLIPVFD